MAVTRHKVAVIGGGITGASVASTLASLDPHIAVHVFDQGRSVGGRASHRITIEDDKTFQWDHGCQFFRADTPRFKKVVDEWIDVRIAAQWEGNFVKEAGAADFFGLPSKPPFFVGVGGIKSVVRSLLNKSPACIQVFEGQRVARMTQDDSEEKWTLYGTEGEGAYHDTDEIIARASACGVLGEGYDAVVLTDISSSFSSWHRASAGVPQLFSDQVRIRAGSRVPLFACMIAFDSPIPVEIDAATLDDPTLWFVSRSNSKPGLEHLAHDCWTLVSTPEYAMRAIEEVPMQDQTTGEFIPQSSDYLTTVPGPALEAAFRRIVSSGRLGRGSGQDLPKTIHLNAQRWGSALPAHRSLDETSPTRKIISGVPYDPGGGDLAPTQVERAHCGSFVSDESKMLFQAGDMVSSYTPGFEGAALSGIDAANRIYELLAAKAC